MTFELNAFAVSGLLIFVSYSTLFLLILTQGKTKVSYIYALKNLAVSIWGLGGFFIGICKDPNLALILWNYTYIGVLFIPVLAQHTILILINKKAPLYLTFVYLQALFFIYTIFTGKMFYGVRMLQNSFYWHQDGLIHFIAFILWVIIISIAYTQLYIHYRTSDNYEKNKIWPILVLIVAFIFSLHNFIPSWVNTYPYGNFSVPFIAPIVSYGILKNQTFDINFIVQKNIIYTFLITIITIIFILTVFVLEYFFRSIFGYHKILPSIISTIFITTIFIPVYNLIQNLVNKIFFRGTPIELANENELLIQEAAQKEKFRAVASLASGIAHEVKNPLTSLKTFIEYFPKKKGDPEFLEKCSKILPHEINRIDNLVKQLMNFSKPSNPILEPIKIKELIDETLVLVQNRIRKQNIVLMQDMPSTPQTINADLNKIKQALLNILLNAIEAMPNGGTLQITTRATSHASRVTGHLEIIIEDTGPGIDKDDLKHIFDPFFTKKDEGTGLGLAVTKEIVEQHDGALEAISNAKEGTKFIIKLPEIEASR